jgi:hypothetical protein
MIVILLKIRAREPLELIWSFIVPCIVFIGINNQYLQEQMSATIYVHSLIPFLCWVSLQSALFGCGFTLIAWRESGFIKTLVQSDNAIKRMLITVLLVQSFYNFIYVVSISIVGLFVFNIEITASLWLAICCVMIGNVLLAFGSIILNSINFSGAQLTSLVNILILPLTWISVVTLSEQNPLKLLLDVVNLINPIYFCAELARITTHPTLNFGFVLIYSLVLIVFALVGLKMFKKISVVGR